MCTRVQPELQTWPGLPSWARNHLQTRRSFVDGGWVPPCGFCTVGGARRCPTVPQAMRLLILPGEHNAFGPSSWVQPVPPVNLEQPQVFAQHHHAMRPSTSWPAPHTPMHFSTTHLMYMHLYSYCLPTRPKALSQQPSFVAAHTCFSV